MNWRWSVSIYWVERSSRGSGSATRAERAFPTTSRTQRTALRKVAAPRVKRCVQNTEGLDTRDSLENRAFTEFPLARLSQSQAICQVGEWYLRLTSFKLIVSCVLSGIFGLRAMKRGEERRRSWSKRSSSTVSRGERAAPQRKSFFLKRGSRSWTRTCARTRLP